MTQKSLHFDTHQLHAGHSPDRETNSRAVPIYQTTSYTFDDAQHAADLFALKESGNIYTRIMNPTTDVLEKRLAILEGGVGALATASGMAAVAYAILNVAKSGDEIIATNTLYGGTYTLFNDRLPEQYGIKTHLVDPDDLDSLKKKINSKTRAIYIETIGNPNINIPDIQAIADIAHQNNLPLISDNTFATPYLINLKEHGVDIVVHSLTKYIGGHGTSIGGAIIDNGTFDWSSGRFDNFTTPDSTYHDIVYADIPDNAGYITKARVQLLRDSGACISPFNSFLILQGLETLSLRVERHCRSAEIIARYLSQHEAVSWVNYPALEDNKYYDRARKYLPNGVGGILTFGIRGGIQAGRTFINSLEIFSLLANVADAKSLVIHPASTTHGQLSEEALESTGISADMVRLSVGLEDVRDLIEDLDQALITSQEEE
ncbi:MAG: O-acetylhomoserine aminocarboxypropyltransferase/cysteine synthase [Clostridiales bacterium]|nr:O-acetylhomoserine aminocarboxypropyltransferase/cysteine synthase [Clostridiales bacterium]